MDVCLAKHSRLTHESNVAEAARRALLALKSNFSNFEQQIPNLYGWTNDSGVPVCTWTGINCTSGLNVTLGGYGLTGAPALLFTCSQKSQPEMALSWLEPTLAVAKMPQLNIPICLS